MGGRKGQFLSHQDLVLTANLSQEQPLALNADPLVAVRQPAVLRAGSSGMLYILLLHP